MKFNLLFFYLGGILALAYIASKHRTWQQLWNVILWAFTGFAAVHSLSFFDPLHILWAVLAVGLLAYLPYMPQIRNESAHNYSAISMYALMILIIGLCYFSNYSTGGESSFIYFSF
jgi:hypothetical protein